MSAPTKQFHRLSIGQNMPDTRAQHARAARAGRDPPDESGRGDDGDDSSLAESSSEEDENEEEGEEGDDDQDADDSDDEDSDDESTNASTIRTRSGITYDLTHLDSESEAKALVGLTGQFDVVNCRAVRSGYDFQLLDRPRVHVGRDSLSCTCSTFQSRPGEACQHIFWLLDQLHGCFLAKPPPTEVVLARDGRARVLPPIEGLLDGQLEAVADRLDWQYLRAEGDGRGAGMTRAEKVRDILSAFSPVTLPEDFRGDLAETTTQTRTAEQCVVQGDFEATMFRLGVHDDGVFSSLCKAMPAGACAAIYFDKVQEQSRRLLADFDRYCATGERPADAAASPGGGAVEVREVVAQLGRSVTHIRANIAARAPHGSEGAAKALVSILEAVAARNKDPLDGNRWGRVSFHGEDEDQRNVFYLLIGAADPDTDPDSGFFVLDALEALPPADLRQFAEKLRDILRRIEVNRAPKPYLLRLGALVRAAEAAGAGGQKRPAAGNNGGNSKRSR
ncbi:hypothetical protein NUU61_006931 [Penicillium alfredii]|uniref:SWIM-type domain-containing protein n=1 Tax=Penicillium alfredii TaxID=1506179 RepID=A0A9W9F1Y5_9EURO|nr:uncharacterized protein NUU61_006931 [Penicillium alfredii]KAJ5092061.1 hypothetical protein NUU61_006931 [Penicillium alfredii]